MSIIQSIPYPQYTTVQRNALTGVIAGYKIENTTTGTIQEYTENDEWQDIHETYDNNVALTGANVYSNIEIVNGVVKSISTRGLTTDNIPATTTNRYVPIIPTSDAASKYLDGNGNFSSLPIATSSIVGGVKSGTDITVDASGNVSVNNDSHTHSSGTLTDVSSDTYTPTVTAGTNVSSASVFSTFNYMRIKNMVLVSGALSIAVTTGNTASALTLTLPISSTFTSQHEAHGLINEYGGNTSGVIASVASSSTVTVQFKPITPTTTYYYRVMFTYKII